MPGDDMMMKSLVYVVLLIPMSIIAVVVIKNEQKKKVQSCSHMQDEIKDLETKLGETRNHDKGYYLFYCNENKEVETDDFWHSIEECMSVAENSCEGRILWIEK